ncbi:MAG: hypothetical protein LBF60_08770, partial [Treponema sp.]|nr:hypothetical protein [Treponema sp.]
MISRWLSASEIAEFTTSDKRVINRRAVNEHWVSRNKKANGGTRRIYQVATLPEDIQAAYAASLNIAIEALKSELKPALKGDVTPEKTHEIAVCKGRTMGEKPVKAWDECTEAEREIARNRREVITAYEQSGLNSKQFVELYRHDDFLPEIKIALGRWGRIGATAIFYQNWLRRYRQFGLAGLAPQYKKRGGAGASLPQDVKNILEYVYLDTARPGVSAVVRAVQASYGITAPEDTARRYLKSLPEAVAAHGRGGPRYFEERCQPSIHRDYTLYKPMDIIVGGYMTQDFMLRVKDKVWRAKVAAFMDMRTRMIVGWDLQLTANSTRVAAALQRCFDTYGLPGAIYFDNGREFKNYWLCGNEWKRENSDIDEDEIKRNIGVIAEAGVKIIFAKPYHGQSKPIERLWRTVHETFDKFEETYIGSNTAARPDEARVYQRKVSKMKKEDFEKIPAIEEIKRRFGRYVDWYNNKHEHAGRGMDG